MTHDKQSGAELNVTICGVEQPKRIWLTCYRHAGDICWTIDPNPDDADEIEVVEYVRADTRSLPQAGEGVVEAVARAIAAEMARQNRDPLEPLDVLDVASAAIASLPPAGRVEEDTVEAIATAIGTAFEGWFNGEREHGDELDLRPAIRTALTGKVHP